MLLKDGGEYPIKLCRFYHKPIFRRKRLAFEKSTNVIV